MTDDGHVTNPQARRTKKRRTKKSKVYQKKEWKASVEKFVAGKNCEWCGSTEKLLAHHPYRDTPDGIYEDLYLSGCIVLCNTCHFMFHRRHKRRCRVCGTGWHDLDVEMCYACYLKSHPGEQAAREVRAAEFELRKQRAKEDRAEKAKKDRQKKVAHPCTFHRIGGKCGKSAIGSRCTFSKTKAKNCPDVKMKIGK
jgi:hypothetical protein